MFYAGEIVEVKGFATLAEVEWVDARANRARVLIANLPLVVPFSQCSLASHVQREDFLKSKKYNEPLRKWASRGVNNNEQG